MHVVLLGTRIARHADADDVACGTAVAAQPVVAANISLIGSGTQVARWAELPPLDGQACSISREQGYDRTCVLRQVQKTPLPVPSSCRAVLSPVYKPCQAVVSIVYNREVDGLAQEALCTSSESRPATQ